MKDELYDLIIRLLKREGWDTETNDSKDSGGRTKWGITQGTLNSVRVVMPHLPTSVSDLTLEEAIEVYKTEYLVRTNFETVYSIDKVIGELAFDFGVLAGPRTSGRLLQRALNVLNAEQARWPDLKVDGLVGPATLRALELAISKSYHVDVAYSVAVLQTNYLIELAERRSKDERFMVGWQRNRAIGLLTKIKQGLTN